MQSPGPAPGLLRRICLGNIEVRASLLCGAQLHVESGAVGWVLALSVAPQ